MADGGLAGLANVRKQLQVDDPTSPANALSTLVKWWSDWRAQQAAEPDVMNPPVGFSAPGGLQGLAAILRDAAGKPMRMYHGTNQAFQTFDPAKADPRALYGKGHYFTNDPTVAAEYAVKGSMEGLDALSGIENARRMNYAPGVQRGADQLRRVIESEPQTQGANVRPAFLDLKKPFDLDAPASADVTRGLPGWRAEDAPNAKNNEVYAALTSVLGKAKTTELLQDLGFDGITHTGGQIMGSVPHKVGIAFDPKQILPPWSMPE